MTAAGGLDPEGLVTFEATGQRWTAFFGFRAQKDVERHYDLPFFQALQRAMPSLKPEDAGDPEKVAAAGASVRVSDIGLLFEFALRKHHPEIDEATVEDIVDEIGLERCGAILGDAIAAALSADDDAAAGSGGAPGNPRRRGRKTG